MRKKFVQIVSLALAAAALSMAAASAAWYDPVTEPTYSGLGGQMMRIGIYFGSSAKDSVELRLVTGDGFEIGYYDDANDFVPLTSCVSGALTVQMDAFTGGITVLDNSTGMAVCAYDGYSAANLGIRPYSLTGEKTVVKCGYPYYGGIRFTLASGGTLKLRKA